MDLAALSYQYRKAVTAVLLSIVLASCAETATKVEEMKMNLSITVGEMQEWAGDQVTSVDQVNQRVMESASGVFSLLRELKYDFNYRENGIVFSNEKGVNGVISVRGNTLILDVASPAKEAEAIHSLGRIVTLFGENNLVEDRIQAVTNGNEPQEIQLENNGSIISDGKTIEVHLQKYLI